ncbi:hypothetical protein P879_11896, partial [Paragonimus westermani]
SKWPAICNSRFGGVFCKGLRTNRTLKGLSEDVKNWIQNVESNGYAGKWRRTFT